MAQGKKSFIAYSDWKDVFDELPNEDAGKLIKHIFAYVNDENPVSESVLINAVFANIKSTLKRDLDKWESQLEQRVLAGKRSAEKRALNKQNEIERSPTLVEIRERNPTVNDNVSVNDNVLYNSLYNQETENKIIQKLTSYFNKNIIQLSPHERSLLKDALSQGYSFEDVFTLIENVKNDTWHKNISYNNCIPSYLFTLDMFKKFSKIVEKPKSKNADDLIVETVEKELAKIKSLQKQL